MAILVHGNYESGNLAHLPETVDISLEFTAESFGAFKTNKPLFGINNRCFYYFRGLYILENHLLFKSLKDT